MKVVVKRKPLCWFVFFLLELKELFHDNFVATHNNKMCGQDFVLVTYLVFTFMYNRPN